MNNDTALKLLAIYRSGKDGNAKERERADQAFTELFNGFTRMIDIIALSYARTSNIPYEELQSHLRKRFWDKVDMYDAEKTENLSHFIKLTLNQSAIDFIKGKHGTYYKRVKLKREKFDKDGKLIEDTFEDLTTDVADEVTDKIRRSAEIGKIIDYLLINCDSITRQIVNEHMRLPNPTDTAISERIGISRTTVKRRLLKLRELFETPQFQNKYGNINDYLAV